MKRFRRTAMTQWQINLRELFKIVTAGSALYAWMTYWSAGGMHGILVGCLIAAAILFWPGRNDTNRRSQIKRSITSLVIATCIGIWPRSMPFVLGTVAGALWLLPEFDDPHWTLRYVLSNAMIAITIMLGAVVSVLRICAGR